MKRRPKVDPDQEVNEDEAPSRRVTDAFDPKLPGFLVAHKRCDQCLFSSNKIVDDERREDVLAECRKNDTYFICHKATMRNAAVVCRGFFDTEPNRACRMSVALKLVVFVDPATGEVINNA